MAACPSATARSAADWSGADTIATPSAANTAKDPTATAGRAVTDQIAEKPWRRTGISTHVNDSAARTKVSTKLTPTTARLGGSPGAVAGSSSATTRMTGQCHR